MAYIGNQPALSYTSFAKQDFTTSATTSYTLDNPVANANELALFINFVRQEPTTAYSASGTSLTLTSATSATDDMYCVYLGKAVQTVNPPNASVGTAQLASTAVTPAKMDLSQDYTFTGKISGQNYPAFSVTAEGATIPNNAITLVAFDTEIFDTDSAFDTATYEFTVPAGKGGKYIIGANCRTGSIVDDGEDVRIYIYINNSADIGGWNYSPAANKPVGAFIEKLYDLSVGDAVEIRFFQTSGETATLSNTTFYGFRIGD
jgi:hypothetical protein